MRFEWYQIECGSGSIGRVVLGFVKKKTKKQKKCGKWDWQFDSGAGSGSGWVAVVALDR
jgi:hypothetical protein